ncbi:MAG: hypothetical protein Q7S88_03615 [Candidatus Daviesbacteria bacterium]|nr:hypothetical protein [Candidatus Daviesbacteria bacterium]
MEFYRDIVSTLLNGVDSEKGHAAARNALHLAELIPGGLKVVEVLGTPSHRRLNDPRLAVTLGKNVEPHLQVKLDNRMILGAGWDKGGISAEAWIKALGAGGVEIGAVLARPQIGNDKPRQFYNPRGVALNRLGFNSPGMWEVVGNLTRYDGKGLPIGINVGINNDILPAHNDILPAQAPQAFAEVVNCLYAFGSWFTINVSSPNTPDLRTLQDPKFLRDIDQAVLDTMRQRGGIKPTYHKMAPVPDLSKDAIEEIVKVTRENNLSGVVVANSTSNESTKRLFGWEGQLGGVSGSYHQYRLDTTTQIAFIRHLVKGDPDFEIHGVGGINDFSSAQEKFQAGADVLQLVTAVRQKGPGVIAEINESWVRWMDGRRIKTAEELEDDKGSKTDYFRQMFTGLNKT